MPPFLFPTTIMNESDSAVFRHTRRMGVSFPPRKARQNLFIGGFMKKATIPNKMRTEIITRDNYTCQCCGKIALWIIQNKQSGLVTGAFEKDPYLGRSELAKWEWVGGYNPISFEIDHIRPECKGGETSIENLQLLCRSCNRSKGGRL